MASPAAGGDLSDARATRALVDAVELALERRLPPTPFARGLREATAAIVPEMSGSFRIPAGHELDALGSDALARIGLEGDVPDAPPLRPRPARAAAAARGHRLRARAATRRHRERLAAGRRARSPRAPGVVLRRGAKPPPTAPGTLRERRSVDGAHAARDARGRTAGGAGRGARSRSHRLGALLGYPACCVQAFAAQARRDDESSAATRSPRGLRSGPGRGRRSSTTPRCRSLPHVPVHLSLRALAGAGDGAARRARRRGPAALGRPRRLPRRPGALLRSRPPDPLRRHGQRGAASATGAPPSPGAAPWASLGWPE